MQTLNPQHRYDAAKKITLIGAGSNAVLAFIKIVFGYLGHSHALVADGVHSVADLVTDALVIVASKFGSKRADLDHPYGHQRIETAATVGLAILLILAGAGIMIHAGERLIYGGYEVPKPYVLLVALVSIGFNEALFHYTLYVSKKTKSQLLRANAWHHRSDAAASLVVLIGVAGALLGYKFCDVLAALIVGVMIIKMGWSLAWNCLRELVDTAPPPALVAKIQQAILSVAGVQMVHQLRTRSMAEDIFVDVHVLVDHNLSVSEGHFIANEVHQRIIQMVPEVADVTVHIDHENDEFPTTNKRPPTRNEIMPVLRQRWQKCPGSQQIQAITFHYLSGRIYIEVRLPLSLLDTVDDAKGVQECYRQAVADLFYVAQVAVLFS